jgi:NAD(P)-dependent dehydrogenase (short-subunit alcohol dehydrogenase family)
MSSDSDSMVWFITGASSGFGRALARKVLEAGHQAALTSRNPGDLDELCGEFPMQARSFRLDLGDADSIRVAVAAAERAFGAIDVLVNNGGRGLVGALEEVSDEQIEENITVNFTGQLRVLRAVLPGFRARGRGRIIQMGAAAAIANYPGFSVYGGAKAGMELACESLAAELAPHGIRVTVVIPGPFRTDFVKRSVDRAPVALPEYAGTSGKFASLIGGMDGKQPGDPERAAEVILRVVAEDKPPFRIVLGTYATNKAKRALESRRSELEQWEVVGKPTEFR